MSICTGMTGRVCTCGMWHGNGGRLVDTAHALAPGVIDGPDDVSDFDQESVNSLLASVAFWVAGVLAVLVWTVFYFLLKGLS